MIAVGDAAAYADALKQLSAYDASIPNHKGRLTQVFLALKFYGAAIPGVNSGVRVPVGLLQSMLDDLYMKVSRPPTDSVLTLFAGTYMPRSGLRVPGLTYAANNWRNNFNIQKGVGCYASAADLSSATFLALPRLTCPHLSPATPGTLSGATCSLHPQGRYRQEDHPKWLQIQPQPSGLPQGYATVDLTNIANFTAYVAAGGHRIPALPLAVALYYDADPALVTGGRAAIDMVDFQGDFNMTSVEFSAYFDDDPSNTHNAALLAAHPTISYNTIGSTTTGVSVPVRLTAPSARARRVTPVSGQPVLTTTTVPPPAVNTGHPAQDYVLDALRVNQYAVYDVSNQRMGYDIYAVKGRQTRYIEVKSSLRTCTPVLTAYEYQTAVQYGPQYVLAVLENFNPTGVNTVHWIPDPANVCTVTAAVTTEHAVSRASWKAAAVPLSAL